MSVIFTPISGVPVVNPKDSTQSYPKVFYKAANVIIQYKNHIKTSNIANVFEWSIARNLNLPKSSKQTVQHSMDLKIQVLKIKDNAQIECIILYVYNFAIL